MKPVNSVLSSYGISIFETMGRLTREHSAINLAQGAPTEDGPADVIEFAARAFARSTQMRSGRSSAKYPPTGERKTSVV